MVILKIEKYYLVLCPRHLGQNLVNNRSFAEKVAWTNERLLYCTVEHFD